MRFIIPLLASVSMVVPSAANARPEDAASLRQIVSTQYGGDANLYAEAAAKDFRKMACDGRSDLIQALIDQGLDLSRLSYPTHRNAFLCALQKGRDETFALLLTRDVISDWEDYALANEEYWTPLSTTIFENEPAQLRAVLENGAYIFNGQREESHLLTREENLVLAAREVLDNYKDLRPAFIDAGYGHILALAENKDNVRYIKRRIGKSGDGGGGLLGGLAAVAGGAVLGGATGLAIATGGGAMALDGDGEKVAESQPPLKIETGRVALGLQYQWQREPVRAMAIMKTMDDGLAARAGIQEGDVVTHIAGIPVTSRAALLVATEEAADMESFEVDYLRGGIAQKTVFGLAASPDMVAAEQVTPVTASASPAVSTNDSTLDQLEKLADLHERGVLSDEEFEQMKARILGIDS